LGVKILVPLPAIVLIYISSLDVCDPLLLEPHSAPSFYFSLVLLFSFILYKYYIIIFLILQVNEIKIPENSIYPILTMLLLAVVIVKLVLREKVRYSNNQANFAYAEGGCGFKKVFF